MWLMERLAYLILAGVAGMAVGWVLSRVYYQLGSSELVGSLSEALSLREQELMAVRGELAAATARLKQPGESSRGCPEDRDDLKLIWGIGPKLEGFLNEQGVHHFSQIARWTDREIDEFERKLEHFSGRIRRENWVESAKQAHYRKYGEPVEGSLPATLDPEEVNI